MKIGARFGIESMHGRWAPKIDIEIIGLNEIFSRDYGIEKLFRGPS